MEARSDAINDAKSIIPLESSLITDDIFIYTFQPCKRIRNIKLKSHYPLSILDAIYPSDSIVIFDGLILDRKNSFNFYKIKNKDILVILPSHLTRSKPELIEKWQKETLDMDDFVYKINLQINTDSRKELSRIKDLKFYKSELKKHLKSSNNLSSFYENNNSNNIPLNIDYPQATSPLCDPLPIIW